jgi:MSHA biogenesis protein MshL
MTPFSAPPSSPSVITRACWLACCLALAGCETMPSVIAKGEAPVLPLLPEIRQILGGKPAERKAAEPSAGAAPAAAAAAPRPADPRGTGRQANDNPSELAPLPGGRQERRFSVVLNGASPEALFMSLLAETPLSVAVDPSVKGPISIALRDVTLREALELLRELHNLEYKVIGRHILVGPAQLQTRIFSVDYPSFNRQGRSDLRVISGSITGSGGSGQVAQWMHLCWPGADKKRRHHVSGDVFNAGRLPARLVIFVHRQCPNALHRFAGFA